MALWLIRGIASAFYTQGSGFFFSFVFWYSFCFLISGVVDATASHRERGWTSKGFVRAMN